VARPQTEIPEQNLKDAISDFRAGVLSIPEIARRHSIPVPVLRRRLKGIAQDGISTTRALVAAQVAGIPNAEIDAAVSDKVGRSVAAASEAMLGADAVFRAAIRLSKEMLESDAAKTLSPKELRDYTSTAKDAMEGVRRVRELDGPADNPLKDLFAQLGASAALRPKADA
jgi:DNA-binding Lrp family transcriptional regulator